MIQNQEKRDCHSHPVAVFQEHTASSYSWEDEAKAEKNVCLVLSESSSLILAKNKKNHFSCKITKGKCVSICLSETCMCINYTTRRKSAQESLSVHLTQRREAFFFIPDSHSRRWGNERRQWHRDACFVTSIKILGRDNCLCFAACLSWRRHASSLYRVYHIVSFQSIRRNKCVHAKRQTHCSVFNSQMEITFCVSSLTLHFEANSLYC